MKFLEERISKWGERELGVSDVRQVLWELHRRRRWSVARLAKKFRVSAPAIRYQLHQHKVLVRKQVDKLQLAVRKLGYDSLDEFFEDKWDLTYDRMADLLGVSTQTVRNYYHGFVARVKRRRKVGR